MARTTQQKLDGIDTLIAQYESEPMEQFSVRERAYRRARLAELYSERRRLTEELKAETGTQFFLAEPFAQ